MTLSGEISLGRGGCLDLVKARLGRPHCGFQPWPPRSSVDPGQPERQVSPIQTGLRTKKLLAPSHKRVPVIFKLLNYVRT